MNKKGAERRHQIVAALADCSSAGTAFYAAVVHIIGIPTGPAIVVSALAALLGILILVPVILLGRFNPQGGSLVHSSPSTIGCITVLVGLFAAFTRHAGPTGAAYLPMTPTIFGGLLVVSAARQRPAALHR